MRRKKLKERVIEITLFIIGFIGFIILAGVVGYEELHYEMECEVVKVSNNLIILEDVAGHRWELEDTTLDLGKTYTVVFNTNDTDTRLDDVIEKVK